MKKKPYVKLTRSVRRFIRKEKARIRRSTRDIQVRDQAISELYVRFGAGRA